MARTYTRLLGAGLALTLSSAANAQSLGTFRWQLQPFCNIVTVQVTQVAGVYRLEGTDDQCGAETVAPVVGVAALNPTGSITLGLNHVTTPGGVPVHVNAVVTLPGASGIWRDSAGNAGAFVLTPGVGIGGPVRPPAGIGAASVDSAQVQLRVTGSCAAGEAVRSVGQDGSVACAAVGGAGGDITGVAAGNGLTGGGPSGDVALAVTFDGPGTASTAARSDHTHQRGTDGSNIAVGADALRFNQTGYQNTAVGVAALRDSTSVFNTALGFAAGISTTGGANTIVGAQALYANTVGNNNVAVGDSAVRSTLTSDGNTGLGHHALRQLTSGGSNVAVGTLAGDTLTTGGANVLIGSMSAFGLQTGSYNVAIGGNFTNNTTTGNFNIWLGAGGATASESNTIRIGGSSQTRAFIGGISGTTSAGGVAVFVNSLGQLGTTSSSRRFKENIVPLPRARDVIQALRPVQFTYRPEYDDGSRQAQYGLIAEEVVPVDPNLVVTVNGEIQTVRYHFLAPLLVAEVQRLESDRAAIEARVRAQADDIAALRRQVAELTATLTALTAERSK